MERAPASGPPEPGGLGGIRADADESRRATGPARRCPCAELSHGDAPVETGAGRTRASGPVRRPGRAGRRDEHRRRQAGPAARRRGAGRRGRPVGARRGHRRHARARDGMDGRLRRGRVGRARGYVAAHHRRGARRPAARVRRPLEPRPGGCARRSRAAAALPSVRRRLRVPPAGHAHEQHGDRPRRLDRATGARAAGDARRRDERRRGVERGGARACAGPRPGAVRRGGRRAAGGTGAGGCGEHRTLVGDLGHVLRPSDRRHPRSRAE